MIYYWKKRQDKAMHYYHQNAKTKQVGSSHLKASLRNWEGYNDFTKKKSLSHNMVIT